MGDCGLLENSIQHITDNAPLCWINSMKDANAQIMRWYLSLQPYNFQILHRPRKAHANANFFSQAEWEEQSGESLLGPNLTKRVCDGVYQPHTGQARVNKLLWAQEATPPHPYWACSQWSEHSKGSRTAQSRLSEEERGCVPKPPVGKLPGLS